MLPVQMVVKDVVIACQGCSSQTYISVFVDIQGGVAAVVRQQAVNLSIMGPCWEEEGACHFSIVPKTSVKQHHRGTVQHIFDSDKCTRGSEIAMYQLCGIDCEVRIRWCIEVQFEKGGLLWVLALHGCVLAFVCHYCIGCACRIVDYMNIHISSVPCRIGTGRRKCSHISRIEFLYGLKLR